MTGMRRGEVLRLRWGDLDLDARRVMGQRAITLVNNRTLVGPTKTGMSRDVDLDEFIVAELRAQRARQARELLLLGIRADRYTLVFCHPDARPYNPDRFSREFDRAVSRTADWSSELSCRIPNDHVENSGPAPSQG